MSFRYVATPAGERAGNCCLTSAASPATWGDAWLVPKNDPDVAESPPSAPTMSGLVRPSVVGPRLLNVSMVVGVDQFAAPTASIPGLALSAGFAMLLLATEISRSWPLNEFICSQEGAVPAKWNSHR